MSQIDKKVLCLGNNTEDTDVRTRKLAGNTPCHGLLTEIRSIESGYYHSSVYDLNVSELLELIKSFDQLIILDQAKSTWSHPDAYYKTVQVAKTA